MLLETMALAGGALAFGWFARPAQNRNATWRTSERAATREPAKPVQAYEFRAGPTACERSRGMNGHQFTVEGGKKLLPVRCGSIDCGCHYRRIDGLTPQAAPLRAVRSAFR